MANEFIARKGLIALDDSQITGSLDVSGSLTINSSGSTLFNVVGSQGQGGYKEFPRSFDQRGEI